jgi:hypothetical protein
LICFNTFPYFPVDTFRPLPIEQDKAGSTQ